MRWRYLRRLFFQLFSQIDIGKLVAKSAGIKGPEVAEYANGQMLVRKSRLERAITRILTAMAVRHKALILLDRLTKRVTNSVTVVKDKFPVHDVHHVLISILHRFKIHSP